MRIKRKTLISLFSGAGGLDRGLQEAGFQTKLSVEIDKDARATIVANNARAALSSPGDIHRLSPSEVLRQARLQPRELDLLAGGPPCQPFSKSSYWVSGDSTRLSDPRSETLKAYLDIVREAQPRVILLENVKGISYSDKNEGLELLVRGLEEINREKNTNYKPFVISLNAADYGVPQLRERIFVVADRDGSDFKIPDPSHKPSNKCFRGDRPHLTAWDAIGDLDSDTWPPELDAKGKWAELLPSIPEGYNYLWHTDRMGGRPIFGWRSRYWSFLLKLAKNQPSWTLQAQPGPATGPFHWKNRNLSITEMARLQTFPDDFLFIGSRRSVLKQIGNAVPPAIGELFGLEIRRQFYSERVRRRLRLIPQRSRLTPPPELVQDVDAQYLALCGSHLPHPGTGKGPRALSREA